MGVGLISLAVALMLARGTVMRPGQADARGPRMPYVDWGACPFEGCVYREWIAERTATVRTARRRDAPVAFRLSPGDKVVALTGVVITTEPGIAEFSREATLANLTRTGPREI